jgi:HipA-like protein
LLRNLRDWLGAFRAEGHEEIETPKGVSAAFTLAYDTFPIGTLRLDEGTWVYEYSPEFRRQSELEPLVAFPDVKRVYKSESLWPFFMARIPGLNQPEIRAILQAERLDEHNPVDLLRRFGERTISNPFILKETVSQPATGSKVSRARVG